MQDTNNKIPVRTDKEIEIMRMELELMNKVVSPEDLKTEFEISEIVIIPILQKLSETPFSISKKIADERGIKFDTSRYRDETLSKFVIGYIRNKKALKRKGIGEDINMIRAYCEAHNRDNEDRQKTPQAFK